jgi:hypothetical protein
METQERLAKIEIEMQKQNVEYNKIFSAVDKYKSLEAYQNALEPSRGRLEKLSREKRMIMPYTLQEMPSNGHKMSLKKFIEIVKDGDFIDYDGSGNYTKDGQMTNIDIYPLDVEFGAIRKDFDTIIWFNR